ncbi:hypothetical protein C3L33_21981, partial [Rhododendron williamsianum]
MTISDLRHTISIWLVILTSQGFAFIYMEDERDAEDAIRRLDRIEFGRKGRWICVDWTKVLQVFEHFIEMLSLLLHGVHECVHMG